MRIIRRFSVQCLVFVTGFLFCGILTARAERIIPGQPWNVSGDVANMNQRTSSMGRTFHVAFQGIRYDGQIEQAVIEQRNSQHLNVRLALRNVQLTINRTRISGKRHSAQCGPMKLELGTQRELWVVLDVQQSIKDGAEEWEVIGTRFELSRDNWRIGSPSWVRTSGVGMTQGRVVSGLRSGFTKNRKNIEQIMNNECPRMFSKIKHQLGQQLASRQTRQTGSNDVNTMMLVAATSACMHCER